MARKRSQVAFVALMACAMLQIVASHDYYSCYFSENTGSYLLVHALDASAHAWGYYDETINSTGYGILGINTNGDYPDLFQMSCAGYLEGALTASRIDQLFRSFYESTFNQNNYQPIVTFTRKNMEWTRKQVQSEIHSDYWKQVELILLQFDGLLAGYNAYAPANRQLSELDLWILNMIGDLDDLLPALTRQEKLSRGEHVSELVSDDEDMRQWFELHLHCSVLVKPTQDGDLISSHTMWARSECLFSYLQMLMIYKHYNFSLSTKGTVSQKVSFASYPGLLDSEDDFYVTDQQLVVMETTNGVFNLTKYQEYITPNSLLSWFRVILANRMAHSGKKWVEIASRYNSGTYNNQWIIVDYKLWQKGQSKLRPHTLWIGSQMPGLWASADVSQVVNSQGYWPSYNIPFLPAIYNWSGYNFMYEKYGDQYSYENCPRAKIFRQRQGSVQDVNSMQHIIRYNNWQNDPLSLGCPQNQIASRYDLIPSTAQSQCGTAFAFGAINGKVTSSDMVAQMQASIIGGPTSDQQTPFTWSQQNDARFSATKHYGQPTTFDFDWLTTQP